MFAERFRSSRYALVPQNVNASKMLGEDVESSLNTSNNKLLRLSYSIFLALLFGLTGFAIGFQVAQYQIGLPIFSDTVPQGLAHSDHILKSTDAAIVSIGWSRKTFRYNNTFARLSLEADGSEPIWDSLIPSMLLLQKCCIAQQSKHGP